MSALAYEQDSIERIAKKSAPVKVFAVLMALIPNFLGEAVVILLLDLAAVNGTDVANANVGTEQAVWCRNSKPPQTERLCSNAQGAHRAADLLRLDDERLECKQCGQAFVAASANQPSQ